MAHYIVLEGEHNCINHATGGDDYDLSVEELRFLCQKYHDEYDAVRVILPNEQEKAFSYTTPVIQPDRPRPPSRRQRILGRIVKEVVLTSSKQQQPCYKSYYTTAEDNRHVVAVNDNDIDNDNVKELGEEDMDVEYDDDDHDNEVDKVKDDRVESSVAVESVGSNDYVTEDEDMDEDESVVESKITLLIDN